MNLFNIQKEYLRIASELCANDGELTDELNDALVINQEQLQEKAVNYAYVIKQFQHEINAVAEEIKRLQELKKRNEKAIERMENAIINAMQLYGIDKVESSFLKLSFRKSESVEVFNENELQAIYFTEKYTRTPDKAAIKKAIKEGNLVIGAHLIESKNLQIK